LRQCCEREWACELGRGKDCNGEVHRASFLECQRSSIKTIAEFIWGVKATLLSLKLSYLTVGAEMLISLYTVGKVV
jgi:hypothetical protein